MVNQTRSQRRQKFAQVILPHLLALLLLDCCIEGTQQTADNLTMARSKVAGADCCSTCG
jgi:hypothetical protein